MAELARSAATSARRRITATEFIIDADTSNTNDPNQMKRNQQGAAPNGLTPVGALGRCSVVFSSDMVQVIYPPNNECQQLFCIAFLLLGFTLLFLGGSLADIDVTPSH